MKVKLINRKDKICTLGAFVFSIVVMMFCLTSCGSGLSSGELSFGEEKFYSVDLAEELGFAREDERLIQVAVGESRMWVLTTFFGDYLYEREFETGKVQSLDWQQDSHEMIMGIAAVKNQLYICAVSEETVQVRRLTEERQWDKILTIPWEETQEVIQPTIFFMDGKENAYVAKGNEVWRYSPSGNQTTVYKLKEPVVFLQEKAAGVVEVVTNTGKGISLYVLGENGTAEKKWMIKLTSGNISGVIQTDDAATLVLAVNDRILFVNNVTGEVVSYFDCIQAGVSTNLFGGLCRVEEGSMYLVERTNDHGGLWEKLTAQSGPWGNRTVLTYGTISLSEAMKERVVNFNKTNRDYYISVEEYDSTDVAAGRLKLQSAITSGHGPDIVGLYRVENYIAYAEKGYLEDLESYLQKEDFCEDILWQIQELYRVNGAVCMLVPHFSVQGLAINPEYAKGMESWNFETFVELAGQVRGKKQIEAGGTANSILGMLLQGMQGEFIDWEEKKAYFDTPEFIRLLELCKECERESLMRAGESYDSDEFVDMVLLTRLWLGDPGSYMELHAYCGEDALPYGYPTADGQVLLVNHNVDACGIYSGSSNKEGAWEFLRTLFDEDYQMRMSGGLNITWGIRESCWYQMWDSYKSSTQLGFNGIILEPTTDEDVELFADLILNGNLTANLMDYGMEEVILEEAGGYFSGNRSAKEVAEVIQNRVQMMLGE